MTLPNTGPLSLDDIQTEFGGSNPISLSEYYANGPYVPLGAGAIPAAGPIRISDFYGASSTLREGARFSHLSTLPGTSVKRAGSAWYFDGTKRISYDMRTQQDLILSNIAEYPSIVKSDAIVLSQYGKLMICAGTSSYTRIFSGNSTGINKIEKSISVVGLSQYGATVGRLYGQERIVFGISYNYSGNKVRTYATSDGGTTWQQSDPTFSTSSASYLADNLCYADGITTSPGSNGLFAFVWDTKIATSFDGATWVDTPIFDSVTNLSVTNHYMGPMVGGNQRLVGISGNGQPFVLTSQDPTRFIRYPALENIKVISSTTHRIAFCNGYFLVMGPTASGSPAVGAWISEDGINWTYSPRYEMSTWPTILVADSEYFYAITKEQGTSLMTVYRIKA